MVASIQLDSVLVENAEYGTSASESAGSADFLSARTSSGREPIITNTSDGLVSDVGCCWSQSGRGC